MPCLNELHGDILAGIAVAGDRPAHLHALGLDREGDIRQRERAAAMAVFPGVLRAVDPHAAVGQLTAAIHWPDLQFADSHCGGTIGSRCRTTLPSRRDGETGKLGGQISRCWQGVTGGQLHRQLRLGDQVQVKGNTLARRTGKLLSLIHIYHREGMCWQH